MAARNCHAKQRVGHCLQAPADGMEAQVAALLAAAGAGNGAAVEEAEEALALQVRCSCSWRKHVQVA